MRFKKAWLTVCGMTLSAAVAAGQQPAPSVLPHLPSPSAPFGSYVPHMPYIVTPPEAKPAAPSAKPQPPTFAPNPGADAGEPYLVLPHSISDSPPNAPEAKTPGVGDIFSSFMATFVQPDEPHTAYEGSRYLSAVRVDNTRMWVQGSFIHWWIRQDETPPLVATGNPLLPSPGVLGGGNSAVLLGGGPVGPQEFSGAQALVGWWLDPERIQSLEIGGFWLGRTSQTYRIGSDAAGSPLLTTPAVIGLPGAAPFEGGFVFAAPGAASGTISVRSVMDLHGAELNIGRNLVRLERWTLDALYGARYLYMNDELTSRYDITTLAAGLPFAGVAQPAGSALVVNDSFKATNRFYGGQIGARLNWASCRWDAGVTGKIAFGSTSTTTIIDGSSTLNPNGANILVPGGVLAQATNSGDHTGTVFAIASEANATLGFQLSPCIRVFTGYTFLFWNNIQRAGEQIDRQVDLGAVPTGVIIPGATPFRPAYSPNRSDFWAHGINVGVELKY